MCKSRRAVMASRPTSRSSFSFPIIDSGGYPHATASNSSSYSGASVASKTSSPASIGTLYNSLQETPTLYPFFKISAATKNFVASSSSSQCCSLHGKDAVVFRRPFRGDPSTLAPPPSAMSASPTTGALVGIPMANGGDGSSAPSSAAPLPPYRPYRLARTLTAHNRAVSCMKFSNDGHLLASASLDKTVMVWSSSSLTLLTTLSGHSEGVSDVAWSSDSHYICSTSDDRTVHIWDVRSPVGECVKVLRGHSSFIFCVNFNPQSNLIVSGSFDQTVRLWDVKIGRCVRAIDAHDDPVTSATPPPALPPPR